MVAIIKVVRTRFATDDFRHLGDPNQAQSDMKWKQVSNTRDIHVVEHSIGRDESREGSAESSHTCEASLKTGRQSGVPGQLI